MILYNYTNQSLKTTEALELSKLKAILWKETKIRLCANEGDILSNDHNLDDKGATVMSRR